MGAMRVMIVYTCPLMSFGHSRRSFEDFASISWRGSGVFRASLAIYYFCVP